MWMEIDEVDMQGATTGRQQVLRIVQAIHRKCGCKRLDRMRIQDITSVLIEQICRVDQDGNAWAAFRVVFSAFACGCPRKCWVHLPDISNLLKQWLINIARAARRRTAKKISWQKYGF